MLQGLFSHARAQQTLRYSMFSIEAFGLPQLELLLSHLPWFLGFHCLLVSRATACLIRERKEFRT